MLCFTSNISIFGKSVKQISKRAIQLESLRINAVKNPNKKTEIAYLNAFPRTFKGFCFLFNNIDFESTEIDDPNDLSELTDKYVKHLNLLNKLSKKYPNNVLSIWLNVSINGKWDADAVSLLQDQIAKYVAKHTKHFVSELEKKSKSDQLSIIKFIADVAGHDIYYEYMEIIKNLKKLKKTKILKYFLEARKERMKHGCCD